MQLPELPTNLLNSELLRVLPMTILTITYYLLVTIFFFCNVLNTVVVVKVADSLHGHGVNTVEYRLYRNI